MTFKTILFSAFLCTFASLLAAQVPQVASAVHDQHKINSSVLGEERTILVRVPAAYRQGDARFPVMYMLDAHPPQNSMMVGLIEQQAWSGIMPEMIVVGIQNVARTRDMTPTASERSPGSGGADKFLDFIQREVMPFVEKNYRTQPFKVFAGHSLGGLLTVYTAVSRPDMFNAYIAASPVLHWDKNYVIELARNKFKNGGELKKTLYIAIGDEPTYTDGFNSFRNLLKESAPKGLAYEFQQFPNDNHGSVVLPAYYAGIRKIFAGWQPNEMRSLAELESHYRKLSERFGYNILVPEDIMNRAGYELLNAGRSADAIEVLKKNVANYPRSSNVYDSLGEAYEKSGDNRLARENYQKAFDLATSQNDAQRAAIYKANLERVSKN